jgi:hypothetical protein
MESLLTGVDNALYTKLNRSDILVPEKNEIVEEMFFSSMLATTAFSINLSQSLSPPPPSLSGNAWSHNTELSTPEPISTYS